MEGLVASRISRVQSLGIRRISQTTRWVLTVFESASHSHLSLSIGPVFGWLWWCLVLNKLIHGSWLYVLQLHLFHVSQTFCIAIYFLDKERSDFVRFPRSDDMMVKFCNFWVALEGLLITWLVSYPQNMSDLVFLMILFGFGFSFFMVIP